MAKIRFRLTGDQSQADAVITALHGLDDVERIEEVDDEINAMRDDSSSTGLTDDAGPGIHYIEVETPDEKTSHAVRTVAINGAHKLGVVVEFVEGF
jgi:hypothetical protein